MWKLGHSTTLNKPPVNNTVVLDRIGVSPVLVNYGNTDTCLINSVDSKELDVYPYFCHDLKVPITLLIYSVSVTLYH